MTSSRIIGDLDEIEVAGADEFVLFLQFRFHPAQQPLPMFAAETG